ncbi:trypsin-like serine peptidase [Pararhodobacter oceanensis]|uniref:Trypsin n=1 Tax=Pararhodobacter oceanensis TaxID=2172121 RepID=A0A2T8HV47_9RHOB|nr:trypsin-like peptidase domain-containing protein [Pararhodobacter oceanensis]PVH29182.1 trypsin [Pararhodobacter oceanensis]
MKRLLPLILALLALPLQAQTDSRLQAMQTRDAARGWEAVGRINMDGVGFCTGTLIAPDRVLTAAHCLFDRRTGQRIAAPQLEFLAGWRSGRAEAIRAVRRVVIWPGFDFAAGADMGNVPTDIALLELDRPIRTTGIRPFDVSPQPPARGQFVAVISYGRGRAEAPSIQETCQVLDQRQNGVSVFSCDIDFGSSGAPVFAVQNDRLRIVSVISARAEGTGRPISLGMQLGSRIDALQEVLDGDRGAAPSGLPQGARSSARFLRP